MKARYLKHAKYKELTDSIEGSSDNLEMIISRYSKKDGFDDLIANSDFNNTKSFMIDDSLFQSLSNTGDRVMDDARNAEKIYRGIKITPQFATNHYFWSYLCHKDGHEYTNRRWPSNNEWDISSEEAKKSTISHISLHFFVSGGKARGLIRNSISRLWWDGYIASTLDISNIPIIEVLRIINYRTDIRASMLERPTSIINIELLRALVIVLKEYIDDDKCPTRIVFRNMMKEINLIGGNELIAAKSKKDHIKFIKEYIESS